MRIDPREFRALDLEVHSVLEDVPLNDVSVVDLPGGGAGRTLEDLLAHLDFESSMSASPALRALFALRALLGRVFGWDRARSQSSRESPLLGHLRSPGGSHHLVVHATHRSRPPRDCLSRRTAYHQRGLGARCTHWAV